jgi:tRNA-modifying protein YgfZ
MDSRGADAPMSLRIVDAPAGAAGGDPLVVDGVEVGTITSVSPAGGLALAMIRRGHDVGRPPVHLATT